MMSEVVIVDVGQRWGLCPGGPDFPPRRCLGAQVLS